MHLSHLARKCLGDRASKSLKRNITYFYEGRPRSNFDTWPFLPVAVPGNRKCTFSLKEINCLSAFYKDFNFLRDQHAAHVEIDDSSSEDNLSISEGHAMSLSSEDSPMTDQSSD